MYSKNPATPQLKFNKIFSMHIDISHGHGENILAVFFKKDNCKELSKGDQELDHGMLNFSCDTCQFYQYLRIHVLLNLSNKGSSWLAWSIRKGFSMPF